MTVMGMALLAFPPTSSFWANYFLGHGGYEQILTCGMILVALVTWPTFFVVLWTVVASLVSLVRQRPVRHVVMKAVALASIVLTLTLPSYVARPMRKVGTLARVSELGGQQFIDALRAATREVAAHAQEGQGELLDVTNLPPVFARAGVKYASLQVSDGQYRLDAATSGRPFRTGWLIMSRNCDEPPGATAVRIADNVWRY